MFQQSALFFGGALPHDHFAGDTRLFKIPVAAMEKGQRRFISHPWASRALLSQIFWGFTHIVDKPSHTRPQRWVELKCCFALYVCATSCSTNTILFLPLTHKIPSQHTNTHTQPHTKQRQQMWVEAADSELDQQSPRPLRLDMITACH